MILKRTIPTLIKLNRVISYKKPSLSLIYTNRPVYQLNLFGVQLNQRYLTTDSSSTSSFSGETKKSRKEEKQSTDGHKDEQKSDESIEIIILKQAMKYVPEFGFTEEAISRGNYDIIIQGGF